MWGMGRRPQPEIRQRILEACADHALAHGLPDRLEPLASAAGTSARMLIYHFGTRDALLRAVLGQARQRQLEAFGELLQRHSPIMMPSACTMTARCSHGFASARPDAPSG